MTISERIAKNAKYICKRDGVRLADLEAAIGVSTGYLPNCPLVPVPPHGRLIDADALFRHMESEPWYDNADRDEVAEELVLNAPTIIPAEPEEEE